MTAHALKVEKEQTVSSKRGTRGSGGRELTLDMIKPDAKGAPVAKYMFPYIQSSGISNTQLAALLGYSAHSNMSMVRNGSARMPIVKAPLAAEALSLPDPYEFGRLVAENNMPEEVMALEQLGVIASKQERKILDKIEERVPAGDMAEFEEKLEAFLDQNY